MKVKDPKHATIKKLFETGSWTLPKVKKSVKDYTTIVGNVTETTLSAPSTVSQIITNTAVGINKFHELTNGIVQPIVDVTTKVASVGGTVSGSLGHVAQVAGTTFSLGKGLLALLRSQQLDALSIPNSKLAKGYGYVDLKGKGSSTTWKPTHDYLAVPFPCICRSKKELYTEIAMCALQRRKPQHRGAWWRSDVALLLDRRTIDGITGNVPIPPCLITLRYARGKLKNKVSRRKLGATPGVGSIEAIRSVTKFIYKKLRKTQGLRRVGEAVTLWGAARHAHSKTDFAILVSSDKCSSRIHPYVYPKLSDSKEILANGCPLALVTLAALFGGYDCSRGWERALQVVAADDGWKLVAEAFKSV